MGLAQARPNQHETFSPSAWKALPDAEKRQHRLQDCEACKRYYGDLTTLFPAKDPQSKVSTGQDENTVTIYTGRDATPKQVGKQVLNKLGPVVERQFGVTIQEVLTQTPKSHIIRKPTSAQKLREKCEMLRQVRDQIQSEYDRNDESFVMQNCISWNLFDKMRKNEGLEDKTTRKRKADSSHILNSPKKHHGSRIENLEIDQDKLLQEAGEWQEDANINWSQLARRYGLTKANGGQVMKEYLVEHGIPAAQINQRTRRAP